MEFKKWLNESYEDWGEYWIHYTNQPFMKINYSMFWNDPLGIYFFPQKYENETGGGWHLKKYKFIVKFLQPLKVFDISKLSDNDKINIVKDLGGNKENATGYFWSTVKNSFNKNTQLKLNSYFRKLGYDAIFDDTNEIYPNEHQLILINPKVKYKVIDVVKKGGTGYKELEIILNLIKEICDPYGDVKIIQPKRHKSWDGGSLSAYVVVNDYADKREKPYVKWKVSTDKINAPEKITTSIEWSNSNRRHDYFYVITHLRNFDIEQLKKEIKEEMNKMWQDQELTANS